MSIERAAVINDKDGTMVTLEVITVSPNGKALHKKRLSPEEAHALGLELVKFSIFAKRAAALFETNKED